MAAYGAAAEGWFHAALPCALEKDPPWRLVPLYEFEVLQPLARPSVVIDITGTFCGARTAI